MADDSLKNVVNSFLGRLPPWPRKALNNSVIGMEQTYRQRKGLPLLTDADIEALKAASPWQSGDAASTPASAGSPPTPEPAATAAAPAAPAPAALFEPAASFKIGYPEEYDLGVDTKWQQRYRIRVDRTPDRLFVIYAPARIWAARPIGSPARTNSNTRATAVATWGSRAS